MPPAGRRRFSLPATRGTDRDRCEPDDRRQHGVPGPRHETARGGHLCDRGRNGFRLWRGPHAPAVSPFATNFRPGPVEVYPPAPTDSPNGQYVQVKTDGGFVDPEMPDGFAPFGIQIVDGDLYVTYAQQNAAKTA